MSKEAHLCYLVSERQTEECVQLLFFQLYHEGSHEGVELHSVRTLHLDKHYVTRVHKFTQRQLQYQKLCSYCSQSKLQNNTFSARWQRRVAGSNR